MVPHDFNAIILPNYLNYQPVKRLKLISAFILILAMGGLSCQKFNLNTDDLNITLDMSIVKTHLIADFRDAKTGLLIGENDNSKVSIYIIGDDSRSVVNSKGYRITETNSAGGYATFGFDPYQAKPSGADTVRVTLMAELNGYVSTSVPIVFTSEGQKYVTVFMVNKVTPPAGVAISPNMSVGSARGGKVSNAFTASTPDKSVEVNVPAGMTILDAKGNPLQGKLDLTFVQADPTKIGAARSFPGGLACEATTETGSKINTSFAPAGFFKIDISDESGRHGAFFSEGTMEVNTKIGPSVINPETGQPYNTGDKIGFWNLEEKTGQWNFVENITVGLDPREIKSNLSGWASGFGSNFLLAKFEPVTCAGTITYNFVNINAFISSGESAEFDIEITGPDGLWVYSGHIVAGRYVTTEFGNMKQGFHTIQFSYNGDRQLANSAWITAINQPVYFCGPVQPTIKLLLNSAVGRSITFNAVVSCTNRTGEMTVPSGTLLHFREKGTSQWTTVATNGRQVVLPGMIIDKTYEVQILYDEEWTPASPYEYTLRPSDDVYNPYSRSISLSIDCGN